MRSASSSDWYLRWLGLCALLVWLMVVVGGVTRLTRSGLSIVRWEPVTGVLPPLTDDAWEHELALYQESPEGRLVNAGIGLERFKGIYWIEWSHRLLGRLFGLLLLVPFVVFWVAGSLTSRQKIHLAGLCGLTLLQGALGWYMVKSGLVDIPMVSPVRLALHLTLALVLFGGLVWLWLERAWTETSKHQSEPWSRSGFSRALSVSIVLTAAFGALMAGSHGGLVYPTFPDLYGEYIPRAAFGAHGQSALAWWTSAAGFHFVHRVLAGVVSVLSLLCAGLALRSAERVERALGIALLILLVAQVTLGVWTVLTRVPVALAALHQAMAVLLFAGSLALLHRQSHVSDDPEFEASTPARLR